MNRKLNRQKEDQQRLIERAAEWFNVLEDASADERAEFMEWISRSPKHLQEFLLTTAVAHEIKRVDMESLAPVQDALAMRGGEVVQLPSAMIETTEPRVEAPLRIDAAGSHRSKLIPRWRFTVGLAASFLIAAALTLLLGPLGGESYATTAGEQRAVRLSDGTVVNLNMKSHIEVRFSRGERSIRLAEGEALFTVAHDAQRPFRVESGPSLIQAVGTSFNVLRRPLGTTVSVIEGSVRVSAAGEPAQRAVSAHESPRSAQLRAGEEARIAVDGRIERRQTVKVGAVAQWRQHRLEFRTDALVDIAAEFNRYNAVPQITVVGDAIKTRHYSGVFDANDPQSLLAFLEQDPELELETQGDRIVIRAR